ncbi:MAG TPA: hypothetical protein VGK99_02780, partial [Acidobacteriota bacterium]
MRIYKPTFTCVFLLLLLVTSNSVAFGVSRYVREGATGNQTGSDWTNAYTQLPAVLVRGDVYYVADGNYSGYTFDDPVSGSSLITIKKATQSDHGADTGWSS